jgi:hypothetical protein
MFKYKIGTVVKNDELVSHGSFFPKNKDDPVYGHVVGFSRVEHNEYFETVLIVRWDNGEEYPIHSNNVLTA